MVLAGAPDEGNADSVTPSELDAWVNEKVVEWWGHRCDMPEVLARASVVVLPTRYREGLPKVLLEAAAAARPVVASNAPGCREIVRDGVNGYLVPLDDPAALPAAIARILADPDGARRMGAAGRKLVLSHFTTERVIEQTLAVYGESLEFTRAG